MIVYLLTFYLFDEIDKNNSLSTRQRVGYLMICKIRDDLNC